MRKVLSSSIVFVGFVVCFGLLPGGVASSLPGGQYGGADYKFVSMPDFINADIGDISRAPGCTKSKPNPSCRKYASTNQSYETALNTILGAVQNENARDVYIAGDFVEGEWGVDAENTGIFGSVGTESEKRRAVQNAGALYYKQGLERFTKRGLTVYPAIGDHEVGDNPWQLTPYQLQQAPRSFSDFVAFKHRNLALFKKTYSDHLVTGRTDNDLFSNRPSGPAKGTAYAVRPHPEVQLISLDVFQKASNDVSVSIDSQQYRWLETVLQRANVDGVDWIIVQAHTPILGPVRVAHSSGLMYQGGSTSPLWKLMDKYNVDLYLAGEVHAVTAKYRDGITQISHGGLTMVGEANYLTGTISGDTMAIVTKSFPGARVTDDTSKLWRPSPNKNGYRPAASIEYPDTTPALTGTMVLNSNNTQPYFRTGLLAPYEP